MGARVAPPAGDDAAPHRPAVVGDWGRGSRHLLQMFWQRASVPVCLGGGEGGGEEVGRGGTLSAEENFRLQWRGNIGSRYEETLRQGLDFRWRLCWPPGDRSRVPSSRFKYQHQDLMTMIA